jgi:hypothetical protein
MGFSDEGIGLVGSGLDIGQQILNKLGLAKNKIYKRRK